MSPVRRSPWTGATPLPDSRASAVRPRVAWVVSRDGWNEGWEQVRARVQAAGIEVELLSLGGGAGGSPSLGSLAWPLRPLTFARLVARLTDGGFSLVHLLDDSVRPLGLPAARFAGQSVVVASVGAAPWPDETSRARGRFVAARALFRAAPTDATLLIAMGQGAAATHAEARRLDPLRWVTLEEGLGAPGLRDAPQARRRGDGPVRVMVDGPAPVVEALPAGEWSVEVVGELDDDLALRKGRYADLWVCALAGERGRARAIAAAQAGAALLVPEDDAWDWVSRCRGGVVCAPDRFGSEVAARCGDGEALRSAGERAAVYVARHLEPGAVTARLLAWYDDLLALGTGTSGPATLDLSALGAGAGATEGRGRRDLLTGLREG